MKNRFLAGIFIGLTILGIAATVPLVYENLDIKTVLRVDTISKYLNASGVYVESVQMLNNTIRASAFYKGDIEIGSGAGSGDMTAAVYDPTSKAADAFDMDNMSEGSTNLILTGTERTNISTATSHASSTSNPHSVTASQAGAITSPIYINMLTKVPDAIGAGTWDVVIQTTHFYNGSFRNTLAAADGDNFTVNFSCPAGTYRFDINIIKNTNAAKLDMFVDAAKILDAGDYYAAVASAIEITSITGVALTAGSHTLKFAINGKNASSSAYIINMSAIQITRTGD
ncbi:MAG: hypothetical protein A2020_12140 [Lentisphaerae bacterium GWF2_45_14]|nr:MAG: hypothetical protein A2020_12140 [Lentisphaerae bacterium GWF2_45_14]